MPQKPGNFRIIAGKWRGKKFTISAHSSARPSLNRVRETLFNWLQMDITDRHCLDAFAGTGALGIEALSRGAASCQFCELDKSQATNLNQQLSQIDAESAHVTHGDFFQQQWQQKFDLIFLDPPFNKNLILPSLEKCQDFITDDAIIYVESEKGYSPAEALKQSPWEIYKQGSAGQVAFYLLRKQCQ